MSDDNKETMDANGNQGNLSDVRLDRRDAVSAAFESIGDSESEATREAPDLDRDEKGRFLPKEGKEVEVVQESQEEEEVVEEEDEEVIVAEEEEQEEVKEELAPNIKMPQTWEPKFSEKWAKLDPEMQAQIEKRERDIFSGIEQYRERAQAFDKFERVISPYMATINSTGLSPEQAINQLLTADYRLRTADPETKKHLFVKLARNYGISTNDLPEQADSHYTD